MCVWWKKSRWILTWSSTKLKIVIQGCWRKFRILGSSNLNFCYQIGPKTFLWCKWLKSTLDSDSFTRNPKSTGLYLEQGYNRKKWRTHFDKLTSHAKRANIWLPISPKWNIAHQLDRRTVDTGLPKCASALSTPMIVDFINAETENLNFCWCLSLLYSTCLVIQIQSYLNKILWLVGESKQMSSL